MNNYNLFVYFTMSYNVKNLICYSLKKADEQLLLITVIRICFFNIKRDVCILDKLKMSENFNWNRILGALQNKTFFERVYFYANMSFFRSLCRTSKLQVFQSIVKPLKWLRRHHNKFERTVETLLASQIPLHLKHMYKFDKNI